jgi:hypothetical protein
MGSGELVGGCKVVSFSLMKFGRLYRPASYGIFGGKETIGALRTMIGRWWD